MAGDRTHSTVMLLLNFCAKFELTDFDCCHKRQAANRWWQAYDTAPLNDRQKSEL